MRADFVQMRLDIIERINIVLLLESKPVLPRA